MSCRLGFCWRSQEKKRRRRNSCKPPLIWCISVVGSAAEGAKVIYAPTVFIVLLLNHTNTELNFVPSMQTVRGNHWTETIGLKLKCLDSTSTINFTVKDNGLKNVLKSILYSFPKPLSRCSVMTKIHQVFGLVTHIQQYTETKGFCHSYRLITINRD